MKKEPLYLFFFLLLTLVTTIPDCNAIWSIADVVVYLGVTKARANYREAASALGCPRNETHFEDRQIQEEKCDAFCVDFVCRCYFGHISFELRYDDDHAKAAISTVRGSRKAVWKELDNREDVDGLVDGLCQLDG